MNVLLISTNRERSPQTLIPLGACYVASAADAAGHEVDLLDLCFERDPVAAVNQVVEWLKPDAIGVSVRNLDNCDYLQPRSYLPDVEAVITACRAKSDCPIILGGTAVSQAPVAIARHLGCKLAISGEGETAFPALLTALEQGNDPATIFGASVVEGERTITRPVRWLPSLEPLPDPQIARWIDLERYRDAEAAYPIQSKRGCTFQCSYCVYPHLEGACWRPRKPEWVAGEVATAETLGMRMVEFVDSVFGLPEEHAIACCEAIARLGTTIPLSTMDLNPTACTPELIAAMNAAGFSAVGITVESGADAILQRLGKGYTVADLQRARENLRKLHAKKIWVFLLGSPGETVKTVRETARFIEGLGEDDLAFITHGVRVLPGTALHTELIAQGETAVDDPLIHPHFYHSPAIRYAEVAHIMATCRFPRANMASLHDGGHRMIPMVQRMITLLGLRPPYWRYLPRLNQMRRLLHI